MLQTYDMTIVNETISVGDARRAYVCSSSFYPDIYTNCMRTFTQRYAEF